jgi:HSP20 family protein
MTKALTPRSGFESLRKEMDRLLERFWEGDFPALPGFGAWSPALDLAETKDTITVKAEVPGMDPKDIQLSLQENTLTIKGEKKQEKEEKDEHVYRAERSYGAFARMIRLPISVDGGKASASFKNGLLTVTLPKAPAAKGSAIPINAE